MGNLRNHKKIFLQALFLIITLGFSGCMTLKTIPVNSLDGLNDKRNFLRVHAEESYWLITNYSINDNVLKGDVISGSEKIRKGKITDVYAAPADAVRVENNTLTLPLKNIGKVDYPAVDVFMVSAGVTLLALFFIFPAIW